MTSKEFEKHVKALNSTPKEEQETVCVYDKLEECWYIESSVRSHINKLLKQYDNVEVLQQTEQGTPIYAKVKLESDLITFRKPVVISEESKRKKVKH